MSVPVSIVICTRNRPTLLRETLESICRGGELPAEIVVVDQSDHPLALPPLAAPVQHLQTPVRGLAAGKNVGLVAARCDTVIFIDDDMLIAPHWLAVLMQAVGDAGPRAVVTGRVLPLEAPGGFVPSTVPDDRPAVYTGRLRRDVLAGGHMAIERTLAREIGPFDERLGAGTAFPSAEDNDFGYRLLRAGCRIVYEPRAVVYHRAWRPESEYFSVRWAYGLGKGGFYTKYWLRRDVHMAGRMVRDVGRRLVRFARLIRRRPRVAVGDLVYAAGVLWGSARWCLTQR